ncbi:hypothetical protein D3C72_1824210 [compost metagenome]
METSTDFQQTGNTIPHFYRSSSWFGYFAQQFQQGTFACTITANNAYGIALFYFKIDIFQSPDNITGAFLSTVIGFSYFRKRIFFSSYPRKPSVQVLRYRSGTDLAQAVHLSYVFCFYG